MRKFIMIVFVITTLLAPYGMWTAQAQAQNLNLVCFTFTATFTNYNQTGWAFQSIEITDGIQTVPPSGVEVRTMYISGLMGVPPASSVQREISGYFAGDPNIQYYGAPNTYTSINVTNITLTTGPCSSPPIYCFSYSADLNLLNNPGSITPELQIWEGSEPFPGNETPGTIVFRTSFAAMQSGDSQSVEASGILGSYGTSFHTKMVYNLQVANESFTITPCGPVRLNANDVAAPAAVFLPVEANGDMHVYGIDPETSDGYLLFIVTPEQIASASAEAVSTNVNVLIEEAANIALYALSSGECQINSFYPDGKPYVFIFPCPTGETE